MVVDRLAVKAVGAAAADRLGGDRARPVRRASWCWTSSTCRRTTRTGSGCSPSTWPACTTTCPSRSWSRGRSRSTRPWGACPDCTGLGTRMEVDPELVVPDPDLTLAEGAIGAVERRPHQRLLHPADRGARRRRWASASTPRGRRLPAAGAARRCCTATTSRCTSATGTGTAGSAPTTPSFEGVDPVHRAAARRGGERLQPGAVRGLHARGAVPGLPRHPAQAGLAGGHAWTAGRSPRSARCRSASWPSCCSRLDLSDAGPADRRADPQGDQRPARLPARRRAWTT